MHTYVHMYDICKRLVLINASSFDSNVRCLRSKVHIQYATCNMQYAIMPHTEINMISNDVRQRYSS